MDGFVQGFSKSYYSIYTDFLLSFTFLYFGFGIFVKWFLQNFEYTQKIKPRKSSAISIILTTAPFLTVFVLDDDFDILLILLPVYALVLFFVFQRVDKFKKNDK